MTSISATLSGKICEIYYSLNDRELFLKAVVILLKEAAEALGMSLEDLLATIKERTK